MNLIINMHYLYSPKSSIYVNIHRLKLRPRILQHPFLHQLPNHPRSLRLVETREPFKVAPLQERMGLEKLRQLLLHLFPVQLGRVMRLVHFPLQIHTPETVNQVLVGRELDTSHLHIVILHILRVNVRRTFQTQTKIPDAVQVHSVSVAQVLIKFIVQGRDDGSHIRRGHGTFPVYRLLDFAGGHHILCNHFCMQLRGRNSVLYRILKQVKFNSHNRICFIVSLFLSKLFHKNTSTRS